MRMGEPPRYPVLGKFRDYFSDDIQCAVYVRIDEQTFCRPVKPASDPLSAETMFPVRLIFSGQRIIIKKTCLACVALIRSHDSDAVGFEFAGNFVRKLTE